jgi:hypothetical protein
MLISSSMLDARLLPLVLPLTLELAVEITYPGTYSTPATYVLLDQN